MKGILLAMLVLLALPSVAGGAVLHVPAEHPTVQAAIDAASDRDVVLIAPGTYFERLVIDGKAVTLASHFYTTGDPTFIDQTILHGSATISPSGNIERDIETINLVRGISGVTEVIGLTFSHAEKGIWADSPVRVLFCRGSVLRDGVDFRAHGSGWVRGSHFYGTTDDSIDVDLDDDGLIVIEYNWLHDNEEEGIEIRMSEELSAGPERVEIRGNWIYGNNEDGIQLIADSTPSNRAVRIEGNLIENNLGAGLGMLCCSETTQDFSAAPLPEPIDVVGNTFRNNDHGISGGANLVAVNNLFVGHQLALKGLVDDSWATSNLFFDNVDDEEDSLVDVASSLFTDPSLAPDGTLQAGSPAIDAGLAQLSWNGRTVLDLQPSDYLGPAPDLGAFEASAIVPGNLPPFVNAGFEEVLPATASVALNPVVWDDGIPAPLSFGWSQVSGPGTATFADAGAAQTTVSFSAPGTYELQLSASDGDAVTEDSFWLHLAADTLDRAVAASSDDAEEELSTTSVNLGSSDLEMVDDGGDQLVGIRFRAVVIPPGSQIVNARLQFTAAESDTETTDLEIRAQTGPAAGFLSQDGDLSARPVTTTMVPWSLAAWTSGARGPEQLSPDLSPLVVEAVSDPAWGAVGDLAFLISGSGLRNAESFDGDPANAVALHVDLVLPDCADGIDNDGDGRIDYAPVGGDLGCFESWDPSEAGPFRYSCGFGPELAFLVPALWLARRRTRSPRATRGH